MSFTKALVSLYALVVSGYTYNEQLVPFGVKLSSSIASWLTFWIHCLFSISFWNLYLYRKEIGALTNELVRASWWTRTSTRRFSFVCQCLFVFRTGQLLALCGKYFQGLWTSETFLQVSVCTVYGAFQALLCLTCWPTCFLINVVLAYLSYMAAAMKQASEGEDSLESNLLLYRKLQVLQSLFDSGFRNVFLTAATSYQFLIGLTSIVGCIRLYGEMQFSLYISMPISLVTISAFGWSVNRMAGQLVSLSTSARRRLMLDRCRKTGGIEEVDGEVGRTHYFICKRCFRSCRQVSVRIGSLGGIQKVQVLKMVSFVVINSSKALIWIGKKQ